MIPPITTRQQMVDTLNGLVKREVRAVDALAAIEAWGDRYAIAHAADCLRKAGVKVEVPVAPTAGRIVT